MSKATEIMTIHITFQKLTTHHFPLLMKWLETPHVKKWWDTEKLWSIECIHQKYDSYVQGYKTLATNASKARLTGPIHAHIIYADEKPIGYIQFYNAQDFPREPAQDLCLLPHNCAAIDWYIGDPDYLGKGIGPNALIAFLTEYVFPTFDAVFVDPDTANTNAIRAYEKAGFKTVRLVDNGSITWMLYAPTIEV